MDPNKKTKTLHVRVYMDASFETEVQVPADLDLEQAGKYASEHIQELVQYKGEPMQTVPGTEEIDPEDIHNDMHTYWVK